MTEHDIAVLLSLLDKGKLLQDTELEQLPYLGTQLRSFLTLHYPESLKTHHSLRLKSFSSSKSAEGSLSLSSSFSGYLRLRWVSKGFWMKTWYCILYGNGVQVYKSRKDALAVCNVHRQFMVCDVMEWDGKSSWKSYKNGFIIETREGEIIECAACSYNEMESWVLALRSVLSEQLEVESVSSEGNGSSLQEDLCMSVVGVMVEKKRSEQTKAAISRSLKVEQVVAMDVKCYSCEFEFHALLGHKRYCGKCSRAFCKSHCKRKMVCKEKRQYVCELCFQRQEFLNFLFVSKSTMAKHGSLGQNEYSILAKKSVHRNWMRHVENITNVFPFDALSLICAMQMYHSDPVVFCYALSQLVLLVEFDKVEVEFYWNQIMELYPLLIRRTVENEDFISAQLNLYLSFLIGVGRRSQYLALRTLWQLLAMCEDAIVKEDFVATNYYFLMIWMSSSTRFSLESSIVHEMWLEDAPPDMVNAIEQAMGTFLIAARERQLAFPDLLITRWFFAETYVDMKYTTKLLQLAIDENAGHLMSPLACNEITEWLQKCPIQTPLEDYDDLSEKDLSLMDAFNNQAIFIKNLTSIAEQLRMIQPPSARKDKLPELLSNLATSIQDNAQLPINHSTNEGFQVLRVLPHEGFVFSTKARAPTLLVFEVLKTMKSSRNTLTKAPSNVGSGKNDFLEHLFMTDAMCEVNSSPDSQESLLLQDPPDELLIDEAQDDYEDFDKDVSNTETWAEKTQRVKSTSPYGHLEGWALISVIAKSFDDMRQEVFALQLIALVRDIFATSGLDSLFLRPYSIVCTGPSVGILETLTNAQSIHAVKKNTKSGSLLEHFTTHFGDTSSAAYLTARRNFIESMAAYSVVCYLFLIKDRHNGNIMLDDTGHVIHIDFGFIFGSAPGGVFSLEDAPFKLTCEMVDIMGGIESEGYLYFTQQFVSGLLAVRKCHTVILALLQLTLRDSPFPSFQGIDPPNILRNLQRRLFLNCDLPTATSKCNNLIKTSYNHWGTRKYDKFQHSSNGILP